MIYLPTKFSPKNQTRDMSKVQIFTSQINGAICTDYQLIIKNNDTNATMYDSTKVHLETPLYDKYILKHSVPENYVTNGLNCKWTLTVWENDKSVKSGEIFFKSYGLPTVTLNLPSIINSQTYDFKAIYSHPQSISLKKFYYILYDNLDNIIKTTNYIYSSNVVTTLDGFLNGLLYKIECVIIDQNEMTASSGKQIFKVSYSEPNVNIIPNTKVIREKSAIEVTWGKAVQIEGVTTGNVSYVNNFIRSNNKALSLNSIITESNLIVTRNSIDINPMQTYNFINGNITPLNTLNIWGDDSTNSTINKTNQLEVINNKVYKTSGVASSLSYSLDIPFEFNVNFKIQFFEEFKGVFCSLGNDDYKIGYDGERFYFDNKGTIVLGQPMELPTEPVYINIRPTDIYINNIKLAL